MDSGTGAGTAAGAVSHENDGLVPRLVACRVVMPVIEHPAVLAVVLRNFASETVPLAPTIGKVQTLDCGDHHLDYSHFAGTENCWKNVSIEPTWSGESAG